MSESEDAEEEQRFFQLLPEIAYIADKVVQLPYNNNPNTSNMLINSNDYFCNSTTMDT